MEARNAAGRRVSLLNDDVSFFNASSGRHAVASYPTPGSCSPSPNLNTPMLFRSDSCDSQMSLDPNSPMTPDLEFYSRGMVYSIPNDYDDAPPSKRPAYADSSRSSSFDDNLNSGLPERPAKRYPCRYRDTHGCEKTFTTSGHASRHSKIHTAEKAVQCTYPGCQKKFTRADNMKQHLETHYKDKSRSSGGQRSHRTPLAETRTSSSSRVSGASSHAASNPWEMQLPSLNRPIAGRTPSGLDALAMAIACQERESAC